MCIILTCERGVRPSNDLIETCFSNNPDGAGIMWCESGMVETSKGFETAQQLIAAIEAVPVDTPLCIHMRIATSGGIDATVCHPFPICDSLDVLHATDVECGAALMHNGVIPGLYTDDRCGISDTVTFVSTVVDRLYRHYKHVNKAMRRRIKHAAPNNRFAILTGDGVVSRIGDGWQTVTAGIHASNDSWRYNYTRFSFGKWTGYKWAAHWYDEADDETLKGDYSEAVSVCCGDCELCATCALYGPYCDDVQEVYEELRGWNDYDVIQETIPYL